MAHFAKIGMNGKVLQVLTLADKDMLDANNQPDETVGQQYLEQHNNWPAQMWVQTSYNTFENEHKLGGTPFRGNYAGVGFEWDEDNNIFWPPKIHSSWVKNTSTARWQSPLGDPPALTAEQQSQNDAETHSWHYVWNESAYQADNTTGWDLTNALA
tara:strand:+ start:131 stop:598 length:468 start_codon:yes stop_codon:yes gene_type:complete